MIKDYLALETKEKGDWNLDVKIFNPFNLKCDKFMICLSNCLWFFEINNFVNF